MKLFVEMPHLVDIYDQCAMAKSVVAVKCDDMGAPAAAPQGPTRWARKKGTMTKLQ